MRRFRGSGRAGCALFAMALLCGGRCLPAQTSAGNPTQGVPPATQGVPDSASGAARAPAAAASVPAAAARAPAPSESLGDLESLRGHYLAAIRTFEAVEPKTAPVWNKMGIACEHMRMLDRAKGSFEQAIKLDPNYADAYNNLGTLYHSEGDLNRAEKLYRKAIKLKPRSADSYQNLGTLYYSKRKFKKGAEAYKQAIAIDPGVVERSSMSGVTAQNSGKTNAEIHYHLACTMAEAGKQQLALEYLRRSILEGFHDRGRLLHEKEFADLRTTPVFLQMVEEMAKN